MLKTKESKGITLIALIITIIVLLILAGVTISAISGNESAMEKAKQAKELNENSSELEQMQIAAVSAMANGVDGKISADNLKDVLNGIVSQEEINKITENGPWAIKKGEREFFITSDGSVDLILGKVSDLKAVEGQKATELSNANSVVVKDNVGNIVKIPKGFGISWDTGDYVQDGVVIEDGNTGNQFVWVPVGTIKKATDKTANPITTTDVTIQLGRYSNFTASNGTYRAVQAQNASNKEYIPTASNQAALDSCFYEFKDDNESTTVKNTTYGNTKAKELDKFVKSSLTNGGYYIARYEAGIEGTTDSTTNGTYSINGSNFSTNGLTAENLNDYKSKLTSKPGKGVWNKIKQPNAAILCRNMYTTGVNSDLMNSYAWDTAIIFIQQCANSSYANSSRLQTSLTTTGNAHSGTTYDNPCNIYDMAGNVKEWTTESNDSSGAPCVCRGGIYGRTDEASGRGTCVTANAYGSIGFRPILYL